MASNRPPTPFGFMSETIGWRSVVTASWVMVAPPGFSGTHTMIEDGAGRHESSPKRLQILPEWFSLGHMARAQQVSPFRLDAKAEILFRGTEPVALGRRAVALLRLLVERAGTPVSKEMLIEAAWPGLAIE